MKIFIQNFKKAISFSILIILLSFAYQTKAQVVAYGLDANGDIVRFDDLEGDPGTFAVVGNSGAAQFPTGLDRGPNGNWFLVDNQNTDFLYMINQALGSTAILVGGSGLDPNFNPQDLAWDEKNNRLLVATIEIGLFGGIVNGSSPRIYEIDVNTGLATPIGGGTGEVSGIADGLVLGLAVDPVTGEIFILGGETERWYKIDENLDNATLTPLAVLGFDVNFGQGGDIGGTPSKLYHAATSFDFPTFFQLQEIDQVTGVETSIGDFTNQISDIFIHDPFVNDAVYGDFTVQPCDGTVTLRIGNVGSNDLVSDGSNIEVSYTIVTGPGAGTTVTEFIPSGETIAVNDVYTYVFTDGITGGIGTYEIDVDIDISVIGVDGNLTNNGATGLIFNIVAPVAIPIMEDFEDGDIPAGWTRSTADGTITLEQAWYYGDAATLSSTFWAIPDNGSGNLMAANDDVLDHDGSEDRLILPPIQMDAVTSGNQVWLFFDAFFDGAFGGSASVEVSTDGGSSWNTELTLSGEIDWQELKVDLTPYIGESCIFVSFRYNDNGFWADGYAVDNVEVREVWPQDAGVSAFLSPLEEGSCLGNETVVVEVTNFGFDPIMDVPVTIDVDGTSFTETFAGPLNFCETATYVFTATPDFSPTTNNVTVNTTLTGDGDATNDAFITVVNNLVPINLPFTEDFEGGNPLDPAIGEGFRQSFNEPNDGGWNHGIASDLDIVGFFPIPGDPNNNMLATREDSDFNKNADRLILPPFDFSPYDGVRFFADVFYSPTANSSASIQISTDKGANWTLLRTITPTDPDDAFETIELNLSEYAGSDCIILSFLYNDGGDWSNGLAVDNINVVEIPDYDARPVAVSIDGCSDLFAPVTVTVENYGTKTFDSFEVSYTVGGVTATETVNQEILPFTTFDYTFTTALDITSGGPFDVDLNVTLLTATDEDMTNDNLTVMGVTPVVTPAVILSEDFEGGAIPSTWSQITNATDGGFLVGTSTDLSSAFWGISPSNSTLIAATNDDACNCDKSNERLVLPPLDLSSYLNVQLEFNSFFDAAFGADGFIDYSTDGGFSWTEATAIDTDGDWQTLNIDLSVLDGESDVRIAFRHEDNGFWGAGLAVDDVRVLGNLNFPPSDITASTANPVLADSVLRGTAGHLIYRMELDVQTGDNQLKDLAFRMGGTYQTSDIVPNTMRLWYNTTDDVSTATLLQTKTIVSSGEILPFNCLDRNVTAGTTYFFYITTDIATDAVDGRTIFVQAPEDIHVIFVASNNTVTASDGGVQTIVRPNTPPVSTDKEIDILTNETYTFVADDFEFNDADVDPVDVRSAILIKELNIPAGASLTFNGAPVAVDLEIPANQIDNLVFTPALDDNGDDYASFNFKISDGREFSPFGWDIIFNVTPEGKPFAPSTFVPDAGSPLNVFRIQAANLSEVNLKIFDRQGNVVFETSDVNEATVTGWDGTKDGEPQPTGAYVWYVTGQETDGTELKVNGKNTGIIKLVR